MKILVAEDEPMMLKTIALRLTKDGHDVAVAEDGQQAMEKLQSFSPDLVITDIMMPHVSGLELVAQIKKGTSRQVPVIILTTVGQEDIVLKAFELGADDYMTKPFSPRELTNRVNKLIE